MLGAPVKGDPQVTSGESGAVGLGLLAALCEDGEYERFKRAVASTRPAWFSCSPPRAIPTRENYRRIVWDGKYPSVE